MFSSVVLLYSPVYLKKLQHDCPKKRDLNRFRVNVLWPIHLHIQSSPQFREG